MFPQSPMRAEPQFLMNTHQAPSSSFLKKSPPHSVMKEMKPWPHGPLMDIPGPKYRSIPIPRWAMPSVYCHVRVVGTEDPSGRNSGSSVRNPSSAFVLTKEHWAVYLPDKKCGFKSYCGSLWVPSTRVSSQLVLIPSSH